MQLESFSYDIESKTWSVPSLPAIDSDRTLVVAFGASGMIDDPSAIRALRRAYPRGHLVGCSSAGEISGTTVRDGSLSVAVARFDKTTLATASVEIADASQSFAAGQDIARKLDKPNLRAVLVFSEGLGVNGSRLVAGLNAVLPASVVVSGGLSGDGARFERTWVCIRDKVQRGLVAAVGFYGDHVIVRHGSKGGWDKFGPERVVTRSENNVLYELDHKPALALYKEYLGDKAAELPSSGLLFPLSMRASARDEKFLVRTLLAVDHEKQSMTFAGDIPKGYLVQLMKADFDRLIDGAADAARTAATPLPSLKDATVAGDTLCVAVSCVGRRLVLGERIEEEVEAVRDVLPPGAGVTGFYSYGEISPFGLGQCDLHNQTMTLTVFSESPTALPRPIAEPRVEPKAPLRSLSAAAPPPPPASRAPLPPPPSAARVAPPPSPASSRSALEEYPISVVTAVSAAVPMLGPSVRDVTPAGAEGKATGLTASKQREGDLLIVRLAGRMTESFKGAALGQELSGPVLFDLADVERITSFGVREWLQMLQEAEGRVTQLYLARCSESIVNQLSMIRRFSGGGRVVSFYAPYQCESCSHQFERLVDCEYDADAIAAGRAPSVACPRCGSEGAFDDEAQTYFAFASQHLATATPREVRAVLSLLERAPDAARVEKLVEGRTTRVRARGRIDGTVRWNRVLDGIEGSVVVDLGGATAITDEGSAGLETALRSLGREVDAISIAGCPAKLAARIADTPSRVRVASVVLEGRCAACGASRAAVVPLGPGGGQNAVVPCKRCGARLAFDEHATLLRRLATSAADANDLAPLAPSDSASAMPVTVAPVPTSWRASPRLGSRNVALWSAVAGVAVVVLGTGAYALSAAKPQETAERAPTPLATPPVEPPARAASNAWGPAAETAPSWAERPFSVDANGDVTVVGHAGPGANEEAVLASARAAAIGNLTSGMLTDLAGSPVYEFVSARVSADGRSDRQRSASDDVARRYLKQVGPTATPERVDAAVRQREGGVEAYARYKLSKQAYASALDAYRQTAMFQGVVVARLFPQLEANVRTDGSLIVIAVQRGWKPAQGELRPGDIVLEVNGHSVDTPDAFAKLTTNEWSATMPSGSLSLQVETLGARRTVRFQKPRTP